VDGDDYDNCNYMARQLQGCGFDEDFVDISIGFDECWLVVEKVLEEIEARDAKKQP